MTLHRVGNALSSDDEVLSGRAIGAYYRVYNRLRYGFVESVYAGAMFMALSRAGLQVVREAPLDIRYDNVILGQFRIDLMVDERLILELKAGPRIIEADEMQLVNHLRIANRPFGLLPHFGPRPLVRRILRPRQPRHANGAPPWWRRPVRRSG